MMQIDAEMQVKYKEIVGMLLSQTKLDNTEVAHLYLLEHHAHKTKYTATIRPKNPIFERADYAQAIEQATTTVPPEGMQLIGYQEQEYIVDGISKKTVRLGTKIDQLQMHINLFYLPSELIDILSKIIKQAGCKKIQIVVI